MDNDKTERLRSLAILYLLLAIDDKDFQILEAEEIIVKLKEWMTDIRDDDLETIINETQDLIAAEDHIKLFNDSAELINQYFDKNNKINVLRDLIDIAIVDKDFKKEEYDIINILAELWDVRDEINIENYIKNIANEIIPKTPGDFLKDEGFTEEEIESLIIDDEEEDSNSQVKTDGIVLPDEIIVKVYKVGNNYKAVVKETQFDFTGIIDNPAKLKYAFERSGLIRGRKNVDGNYVWRVISK